MRDTYALKRNCVSKSLYYSRAIAEHDKQLLRTVNIPGAPGYGEQVVEMLESEFYSMSAARRDLGID
jgi:hypothetical protein